jgi:hypothetical protein
MVAISQNAELVTIALGGIAAAAVLMGGPLTVAAGAIALVLGGMAVWKRYSSDMAEGSDTAKTAQEELNAALDMTPAAAEAAGVNIIKLANDNKKFAESALDAAEASLAQQEAMLSAEKTRLSQVNKDIGEGDFPVLGTANMLADGVIEAQQNLAAARAAVDRARQSQGDVLGRVIGSSYGEAQLPTTLLRSDGFSNVNDTQTGETGGDVTIKPLEIEPSAGVGSAAQLADQLEQRLEVLTQGLATEAEVVAQWYEEGQSVLEDALAKGLLTEEEYREQRERLEEEHQKRMNAIKQAGAAADLATVAGAGAEILNAIGENNKKALKLAKVFGAAEALINTYQGASQELKKGGIAGFAAAAAVIAKGIGFVNAIKSVGDNGSTGGGGGGGAASTAASAPALPTQTVAINLQGDTFSRGSVEGLLEQIQSQLDRGGRLVFS